MTLRHRALDAPDGPAPVGGYAQAVETAAPTRWLHVSGQIPVAPDGRVPEGFEAQCRRAWANVEAQLRAGGMSLDDLVKVTTYLADRRDGEANGRIRREVLGVRRPALTVIVAGIYDAGWLLEIEAVAAR